MSKLTEDKVVVTLFRMAFPMLVGTVAMNTYNLIDTWFVAQLGTIPLAAMGFTFPVVMLLTFIAGGIGAGVTSLTSHALGRGDLKTASRIVTHGLLLTMLVSGVIAVAGYLGINRIFSALGADAQTLPLVTQYMRVWYIGAIFMAFPMMGNGVLISLGDSKSASCFMALGAVLNCVLDPIMIFGRLGIPALGISGAALATVIAQTVSSIWLFYLLFVKHKLLNLPHLELGLFLRSSRLIMGFAIPGSISMILMPISSAVITSLMSRHGNEAVAGASAAGRIEMFAFVIPMALGISLVPFVSQNFGAGRFDRIHEAKVYSIRFALLYGAAIALLFFLTAPLLARLFTDDGKVEAIFTLYIRIIAFGYGLMEVHRYCGLMFTGIHQPVSSTLLNAFRVLVLLIPLSLLGNRYLGFIGIFIGRLVTDFAAGGVSFLWISRALKKHDCNLQEGSYLEN